MEIDFTPLPDNKHTPHPPRRRFHLLCSATKQALEEAMKIPEGCLLLLLLPLRWGKVELIEKILINFKHLVGN